MLGPFDEPLVVGDDEDARSGPHPLVQHAGDQGAEAFVTARRRLVERIVIGSDSPVSIQTMWKEGIVPVLTDKQALFSLLDKIEALQSVGCSILRFAVPDMESADALCRIAEQSAMPLVADIHFD